MEINWLGLMFLIVAWACSGVSTGFSFYLYAKEKAYDIDPTDNGWLLSAAITAAVAVGLLTIVALMIIFMGRNKFKSHADIINKLMTEKLELENKLNNLASGDFSDNEDKSILDNPLPIRRGRSNRPLIV